jgi:hypothetical protein
MIGKTLSHYEIIEKLGEGGMGVVFKARDTHLDRFVALKILPPEKVADPDRKRRFVQEAKAAIRWRCANKLRVGELLAIQWQNVDLQRRTLQVGHSLWKNQLISPKTKASARPIPLGHVLTGALASHRAQSACTGPADFVFCKPDGVPFNPDVLRKDVWGYETSTIMARPSLSIVYGHPVTPSSMLSQGILFRICSQFCSQFAVDFQEASDLCRAF